jgi:DNA-binding GntR family transcriptional regulator
MRQLARLGLCAEKRAPASWRAMVAVESTSATPVREAVARLCRDRFLTLLPRGAAVAAKALDPRYRRLTFRRR